MSRYQFRHGRTLDALELRGGQPIKASSVRKGDVVISLDHPDKRVFSVMEKSLGASALDDSSRRVTFDEMGNDFLVYDHDEIVYVVRDTPQVHN